MLRVVPVCSRDPFNLRDATTSDFGSPGDADAGLAKCENPAVLGSVGLAASVPTCSPRDLDALSLALPSGLVIIARGLESYAKKHVLHGLQYDPRNASTVGNELRQIHDTRHC
jgi:hypothetical protein